MTIDTTILALLISLILAVLAGGVWVGRMSEKIRGNRFDIEGNKDKLEIYRKENKDEHAAMIVKLDRLITNGGRKSKIK